MEVVATPVMPVVEAVAPVESSIPPVMPVIETTTPVESSIPPVMPVVEAAAPVKSSIAGVMPVDESSRFLIVEAPTSAPVLGESQAGQRHIDAYRQGGNPQGKPERFQFEHRILLLSS